LPPLVQLRLNTLLLPGVVVAVLVAVEGEVVASVLHLVRRLLLEQLIQSLSVQVVQVRRLEPIAEKTGLLVLLLVLMA
jgi:hypothetical protein